VLITFVGGELAIHLSRQEQRKIDKDEIASDMPERGPIALIPKYLMPRKNQIPKKEPQKANTSVRTVRVFAPQIAFLRKTVPLNETACKLRTWIT
jgi:hypothetical protein